MSLEAAIQANTDALSAFSALMATNNELLAKINEGREVAIQKIEENTAPKASKAKAKEPEKATEPKVDDFSGDEGRNRIVQIVTDFLNVSDETEKTERMNTLGRALVKLEAYAPDGKAKMSALPEGGRATLAGWLKTIAAGENVAELSEEKSNSLLD